MKDIVMLYTLLVIISLSSISIFHATPTPSPKLVATHNSYFSHSQQLGKHEGGWKDGINPITALIALCHPAITFTRTVTKKDQKDVNHLYHGIDAFTFHLESWQELALPYTLILQKSTFFCSRMKSILRYRGQSDNPQVNCCFDVEAQITCNKEGKITHVQETCNLLNFP